MDEQVMRLECLRMASQQAGTAKEILELAKQYYAFVSAMPTD